MVAYRELGQWCILIQQHGVGEELIVTIEQLSVFDVQVTIFGEILGSTWHWKPVSGIPCSMESVSRGVKPARYTSKLYLHNIHTNPIAAPSLILLRKHIPPELLKTVAFCLVLLVHVDSR